MPSRYRDSAAALEILRLVVEVLSPKSDCREWSDPSPAFESLEHVSRAMTELLQNTGRQGQIDASLLTADAIRAAMLRVLPETWTDLELSPDETAIRLRPLHQLITLEIAWKLLRAWRLQSTSLGRRTSLPGSSEGNDPSESSSTDLQPEVSFLSPAELDLSLSTEIDLGHGYPISADEAPKFSLWEIIKKDLKFALRLPGDTHQQKRARCERLIRQHIRCEADPLVYFDRHSHEVALCSSSRRVLAVLNRVFSPDSSEYEAMITKFRSNYNGHISLRSILSLQAFSALLRDIGREQLEKLVFSSSVRAQWIEPCLSHLSESEQANVTAYLSSYSTGDSIDSSILSLAIDPRFDDITFHPVSRLEYINRQIHFWMSDENLIQDALMRGYVEVGNGSRVSIQLLLQMPRFSSAKVTKEEVITAITSLGTSVKISSDGLGVVRETPFKMIPSPMFSLSETKIKHVSSDPSTSYTIPSMSSSPPNRTHFDLPNVMNEIVPGSSSGSWISPLASKRSRSMYDLPSMSFPAAIGQPVSFPNNSSSYENTLPLAQSVSWTSGFLALDSLEISDHDHKLSPLKPFVSKKSSLLVEARDEAISLFHYWFSDANLQYDDFLQSMIRKNRLGLVPLREFEAFSRLTSLFTRISDLTWSDIIEVALKTSSKLVVSTPFGTPIDSRLLASTNSIEQISIGRKDPFGSQRSVCFTPGNWNHSAFRVGVGVFEDTFTVFSFNILADYLCNTNVYPECSEEVLSWPARRRLITREIDYWMPDIVCLQEVQGPEDITRSCDNNHAGWFVNWFSKRGYDCQYARKCTFGGKSLNHPSFPTLGILISWKRELFRLHRMDTVYMADEVGKMSSYPQETAEGHVQVALNGVFQHVSTGRPLVLSTIHVLCDFMNPHNQLLQICAWSRSVWKSACYAASEFSIHDPSSVPIIMCGDLNSDPSSDIVRHFMKGGFLAADRGIVLDAIRERGADLILQDNFGRKDILIQPVECSSAYEIVLGSEPECTNYVIKPFGLFSATLDYIFFSHRYLEVISVLQIPNEEALTSENNSLPNTRIPSDHVSLLARFAWRH